MNDIDKVVKDFIEHLKTKNVDPNSIEVVHTKILYSRQGKDHVITEKFTYDKKISYEDKSNKEENTNEGSRD